VRGDRCCVWSSIGCIGGSERRRSCRWSRQSRAKLVLFESVSGVGKGRVAVSERDGREGREESGSGRDGEVARG